MLHLWHLLHPLLPGSQPSPPMTSGTSWQRAYPTLSSTQVRSCHCCSCLAATCHIGAGRCDMGCCSRPVAWPALQPARQLSVAQTIPAGIPVTLAQNGVLGPACRSLWSAPAHGASAVLLPGLAISCAATSVPTLNPKALETRSFSPLCLLRLQPSSTSAQHSLAQA